MPSVGEPLSEQLERLAVKAFPRSLEPITDEMDDARKELFGVLAINLPSIIEALRAKEGE